MAPKEEAPIAPGTAWPQRSYRWRPSRWPHFTICRGSGEPALSCRPVRRTPLQGCGLRPGVRRWRRLLRPPLSAGAEGRQRPLATPERPCNIIESRFQCLKCLLGIIQIVERRNREWVRRQRRLFVWPLAQLSVMGAGPSLERRARRRRAGGEATCHFLRTAAHLRSE